MTDDGWAAERGRHGQSGSRGTPEHRRGVTPAGGRTTTGRSGRPEGVQRAGAAAGSGGRGTQRSSRPIPPRSAQGRTAGAAGARRSADPNQRSGRYAATGGPSGSVGRGGPGGRGGSRGPGDGRSRSGENSGSGSRFPWPVRILGWMSAVVLMVVLAVVVAFGVMYAASDVPEPGDVPRPQRATILASDENTQLASIVPQTGNRREVALDQIPEHVVNAVMAAEDREFETNQGFSFTGFGRAVWGQITGDSSAGGGSTITQQYVKNSLVGDERSYSRKFKELVLSTKMANQWSKSEIMQAYLNTIYFGRGAYGIGTAAQVYFGGPIEEVTPEQGALLAAVIQAPGNLDPASNHAAAEARWNYVLDGMVSMGRLSSAERAQMIFPEPIDPNQVVTEDDGSNGPNGHVKARVIDELHELGFDDEMINTRGLQIVTTIDPYVQDSVVSAVQNNMEGEPDNLLSAAVSMDPRTGGVRGYYGGADGNGFDFANAPLMTGSSFKVYGLAAALDQGISLATQYSSAPYELNDQVTITNAEGTGCGVCSIAQATKMSLNTSFYRLQDDLEHGPDDVAEMAHRAGVAEHINGVEGTTLQEENGHSSSGIILGQYQSRILDMATGYSTFANSGVYHQPHFVQKVIADNGAGDVLYDRGSQPGERRISAAVADNVTSALEPVAAYARSHGLSGGRPSAAKTGTVQLGDTGQNRDAWMVGYTPQLTTAVWVGTADGSPLLNVNGAKIWGSSLPADIWKSAMDKALLEEDWESFPTPEAIGGYAGAPSGGSGSSSGSGQTSTTVQPTPETTTEPVVPEVPDIPEVPEVPDITEVPVPTRPEDTSPTIPGLPDVDNPLIPGDRRS